MVSQKREYSRKPDQIYEIVEACSPGPYLELFARAHRPDWSQWGDESPQRTGGQLRLVEREAQYGS